MPAERLSLASPPPSPKLKDSDMPTPFPHDPILDDHPVRTKRREERDPDVVRQQQLDNAWQFPDDDRDDGYEPLHPRITACIDHTQGRFR